MVWGRRREEGSGWGTHVYLRQIHFDIWQKQYNIVKLNKIKFKKLKMKKNEKKIKIKKKTLSPWKESYDLPRKHIKKQRHYFVNKGVSS